MWCQWVRCGKKIARDNLCVRSLTTTFEPQRPNQWRAVGEGVRFCPRAGCGKSACPERDWIAENPHAIVPWMCRDRVDRHHRWVDRTGLFIRSAPATDEDAAGTPIAATTSMPRQRLRSIPRESATQQLGITGCWRFTDWQRQLSRSGRRRASRRCDVECTDRLFIGEPCWPHPPRLWRRRRIPARGQICVDTCQCSTGCGASDSDGPVARRDPA